ncbi:trans-2,3-dihydro-3-hydroxyanthranilate isomerase [Anaerosolibacter carboniphilus]|uniref:Trans-2,3-dihydro-3-hydroxyanthranilate isomerase n=1 Tax=Anaerosolibacter carboniphilus TaxID=1417629 RepID=A0A841KXI8_9FIRM|nr:PhzF family phenazine biosynthesis protein [Anaerosolibacter carboniphilus]MBB6218067.1 trans-2,3-dihydro-3-hydroxyanthranilate isomerase [Anaerosolibacter carboniphilus]
MEKIIYQVDAFTDKRFGGNPAGVVPDARGLTDQQMLKIAKEMNLSETAFVIPMKQDGVDYEVRFFTPEQEVDLCGHATIGTFYALAEKGYIEGKDGLFTIRQKTKAGILPVEIYFKNDKIDKVMMTQAQPEFLSHITDLKELAEIFGIDEADFGIGKQIFYPQGISTGLPDLMMPVKCLDVLKKLKPNKGKLIDFSNRNGLVGVHAFTLETEEKESFLACRNFAPAVGIDEEAATGTSNGALGAFLIRNNIVELKDGFTFTCEQGYYMDRPSKIVVKLEGNKDDFSVKVGGQAVITLEGVIIYA